MKSVRLLRDPKRIAVVACAIWLIVAMVLAWATAQATRGIVTYQPIASGDAETALVTVLSLLLIAWAMSQGAASSSSRTVQLAGPMLALALTAIAISVESKARAQVHEWMSVGWSASAETTIAPFTLTVGIAAIVLTVWIDARRPAAVREKTTSFFSEWDITRQNVARMTIAIAGAVLGAGLGLSLGVYLTNGWGYAALLFMLLSALGMFIGAKLGQAAGRSVVAHVHLPHLLPLGPRALPATAQPIGSPVMTYDSSPALGDEVWMAPGSKLAEPAAAAPSTHDGWQRPNAGSALSEDGVTAPMVDGLDPTMWRRPDQAG